MENIDIEELEAMLYGQVFHGYAERMNEENEVSTVTIQTNEQGTTCSMIQGQKYFKRYFQGDARVVSEKTDLTRKPSQFSKTYPNSTVITCDTTNSPIINQITINQYTCSPLPSTAETSVHQEKQKQTKTRKGKKTKSKKKQAQVPIKDTKKEKSSKKITKQDDVICLSDSDANDDCVVVSSSKPVKNIPKKLNRGTVIIETSDAEAEASDDNDDIIYIAPPPVPVINVDPDSENENSPFHIPPDAELVCSLDTSASNDFLDEENSQMLPDKFNFSLQANDFDNGDFVRPSNPSEVYQTSESSTSEQREFNNTVKTIVFNEVEFPQADLFSETNLETFGLFITPKKVTKSSETNTGRHHGKKNKAQNEPSDSSSSESDYSPQELASNRKGSRSKSTDLPTLCPMQLPNTEKEKPKKSKKRTTEKCVKGADDETETVEKSAKGKEKTKKTSLSDNIEENTENIQKMSKTKPSSVKKKRHSKNSSSSETQNVNDASETSVSNAEVVSKKKRTSKSSQSDETIENSENNTSSNNKKRKKSSRQDSDNLNDNLMTEAAVDISGNDSEAQLPESQTQKDISVGDNDEDAINNEAQEVSKEVILDHTDELPLDDNAQFMELTVVDEVNSDKEDIEIIDDSSSNEDFRTLDDVGNELELVNTSLFVETVLDEDGNNDLSKFDVKSVQQNMTDDPQFWQISSKDRAQLYAIKQKGPRCTRCRQRGHLAFRCPNKPGAPSCSLCGREGHLEPRCPNRVCFQCATNGSFSTTSCWKCADYRSNVCTVCHTVGHNIHVCPDLWRRYHLTTTPGPVIASNVQQLKPRNEQWCAGCAQQGHLEFECNSYCYNREYPAVSPAVFEYTDVYHMLSSDYSNSSRMINPLSLMRNIPNQPEESFVQENRSIFQLHQEGTSQNMNIIPPLMSMALNQQVINPFSIFNNARSNQSFSPSGPSNRIVELGYDNVSDDNVISGNLFQKYGALFTNGPVSELQCFIHKEVMKLSKVNDDIKDLKKKYYTIQHLRNKSMHTSSYMPKKVLKRISEFYRRVNMFIFGVHQLRNGKKNLDYLRNFVVLPSSVQLTFNKRDNLKLAYEYIFAGVPHNDTDYIKVLTQIYINKSRKRRH